MNFKIKVTKLDDGGYMASIDWGALDGGKTGTPGGVVYADSGGEAYEILKGRLEGKGHVVVEYFNPSPTLETPQNTGGNEGEGVGEQQNGKEK